MNKPLTSAQLLDSALALVASPSIRSWANGQRAEWIKIAHQWRILNGNTAEAVRNFSTYITATTIGA